MSLNMQHPTMAAYWLWCDVGQITQVIRIDVLSDDVLLVIFDLYMKKRSYCDTKTEVEK